MKWRLLLVALLVAVVAATEKEIGPSSENELVTDIDRQFEKIKTTLSKNYDLSELIDKYSSQLVAPSVRIELGLPMADSTPEWIKKFVEQNAAESRELLRSAKDFKAKMEERKASLAKTKEEAQKKAHLKKQQLRVRFETRIKLAKQRIELLKKDKSRKLKELGEKYRDSKQQLKKTCFDKQASFEQKFPELKKAFEKTPKTLLKEEARTSKIILNEATMCAKKSSRLLDRRFKDRAIVKRSLNAQIRAAKAAKRNARRRLLLKLDAVDQALQSEIVKIDKELLRIAEEQEHSTDSAQAGVTQLKELAAEKVASTLADRKRAAEEAATQIKQLTAEEKALRDAIREIESKQPKKPKKAKKAKKQHKCPDSQPCPPPPPAADPPVLVMPIISQGPAPAAALQQQLPSAPAPIVVTV